MSLLPSLISSLAALKDHHSRNSSVYAFLANVARQEVGTIFSKETEEAHDFGVFGSLSFPYQKLGSIDSLSLFDLDELLLFAFYWANKGRYKRVADIGANIGLHSVLLDKAGYEVRCFEPDPFHAELLQRNLKRNKSKHVTLNNAAVSATAGTLEFIRVLGNTTGSHVAGAKDNPYGDLERFPVAALPIGPIMEWADLVKMDAEGHEKDILLATNASHWEHTDMLVEIQSPTNAKLVYEHLSALGVNMFSQKCNWQKVKSVEDVPVGYKEGTLFISPGESMPWG